MRAFAILPPGPLSRTNEMSDEVVRFLRTNESWYTLLYRPTSVIVRKHATSIASYSPMSNVTRFHIGFAGETRLGQTAPEWGWSKMEEHFANLS